MHLFAPIGTTCVASTLLISRPLFCASTRLRSAELASQCLPPTHGQMQSQQPASFSACARTCGSEVCPLDNATQRLQHTGLSRTVRVCHTSTLVRCRRDWQGVLWAVASIRCSETTAARLSCPPPKDRRQPRTRTSAVASAGGWQSRPAARHHRPGVSRTLGT